MSRRELNEIDRDIQGILNSFSQCRKKIDWVESVGVPRVSIQKKIEEYKLTLQYINHLFNIYMELQYEAIETILSWDSVGNLRKEKPKNELQLLAATLRNEEKSKILKSSSIPIPAMSSPLSSSVTEVGVFKSKRKREENEGDKKSSKTIKLPTCNRLTETLAFKRIG